ncbi:MAG: multicopper oxidase family protein [Bauldia litoralis]
MLTRRHFLAGTACLASGAAVAGFGRGTAMGSPLPAPADPSAGSVVRLDLTAAERPTALPCFAGHRMPMWTFSDGAWPPVARLSLGDRLDVLLENSLPGETEHTSIHWHGIRLPNDQDGVPYLVQPPVEPGQRFRYSFVPPDTGTFFFHTHCNTAEQLGRGLVGVLIVDGDTTEPYAADETVLLCDWPVDLDNGTFRSFSTTRGASKAGTYGNLRSANGSTDTEIRFPASADCRLRLINSDRTRVMEIAIEDADAAVIAIDGIAVPPFALTSWLLAPAGRLDLVIRSPREGGVARLVDRRVDPVVALARLVGAGPAGSGEAFDPRPLRAGRIAEPDLASAERLTFSFAAGKGTALPVTDDPVERMLLGSLCLSTDAFWTINGVEWPGRDHAVIPPPLAVLRLGRSYVLTLENAGQIMHPIHIHGHSFKVLSSNKRDIPVHHADTVLLMPEETVEVAFVADNPGKWMFHCHVIEHQETGMMGYVEVV